MTHGPYRKARASTREGSPEGEWTARLVVLGASAAGWTSVVWSGRSFLSAATPIDAAWLAAGALFGAGLAHGASGSRRAAWVSIVAGAVGGALLGSAMLASGLAARGVPVAAGARFALANGGALGAACGFLLGAVWAPTARATRATEWTFAVGRPDAASLALTWLGFVGAAGAAVAFATGIREGLAGALLALLPSAVGSAWVLARDARGSGRVAGEGRRAERRPLVGAFVRAVVPAGLSIVSGAALLTRPAPAQTPATTRWADAALEAFGPVRPHVGHMVGIPGGTFTMGSPATPGPGVEYPLALDADEFPAHPVTVDSFELDDTEVTETAYRQCVLAKGCSTDGLEGSAGPQSKDCNWNDGARAEHPINCVSWYQADAYCRWAGKRLPTEAEWEYAARGGTGQPGHWHDTAGPCSCDSPRGPDHTCPVGRSPSSDSPELVLDLSGNVWEWTASAHCLYPAHACSDHDRVARGGGWTCTGRGPASPWSRFYDAPGRRDEELGFRCAR